MAALAILSPYKIQGLTPRESEIAVYVALGYKNVDIARRAGVTEQTVKNHLGSIYRALHLTRREQLEPIVWEQIPQVREEMLKLGRAPENANANIRPVPSCNTGTEGGQSSPEEIRS